MTSPSVRIRMLGVCALLVLLLVGFSRGPVESYFARRAAAHALVEAKRSGFPTSYSDFQLSISPDEERRAQAVTNAGAKWRPVRSTMSHNWMSPVGRGIAHCGWAGKADWSVVESELALIQRPLDRAVAVLLEDAPLRFVPVAGADLLLPHLAHLKSLGGALSARVALELRCGRTKEAWTNLSALTALALRFEPEPAEVSYWCRAILVRQAFALTWEALRTNAWTDQELVELSERWRRAEFFADIPKIPALSAALRRTQILEARYQVHQRPSLGSQVPSMVQYARSHPLGAIRAGWSLLRHEAAQIDYLRSGSYRDEVHLLNFARQRAADLQTAIAAPTWQTMQSTLETTNLNLVKLTAGSVVQSLIDIEAIQKASARFSSGFPSTPGAAAESEALRRVLLTALAVERHRLGTGLLPESLADLPDAQPDFITGTALQYQPSGDDFVLYSVGLNGNDEGGEMVSSRTAGVLPLRRPDLVWPRLATLEEAKAQEAAQPGVMRRLDPSIIHKIRDPK